MTVCRFNFTVKKEISIIIYIYIYISSTLFCLIYSFFQRTFSTRKVYLDIPLNIYINTSSTKKKYTHHDVNPRRYFYVVNACSGITSAKEESGEIRGKITYRSPPSACLFHPLPRAPCPPRDRATWWWTWRVPSKRNTRSRLNIHRHTSNVHL